MVTVNLQREAVDKPDPPAEAVLIRRARLAGQVRAAEAASDARISVARWSQIENGYERRGGEYVSVRASDGLLAHMAHAVGLDAERLEAAGRADAAEILREIERPVIPASEEAIDAAIDNIPGLDDELREGMKRYVRLRRQHAGHSDRDTA